MLEGAASEDAAAPELSPLEEVAEESVLSDDVSEETSLDDDDILADDSGREEEPVSSLGLQAIKDKQDRAVIKNTAVIFFNIQNLSLQKFLKSYHRGMDKL